MGDDTIEVDCTPSPQLIGAFNTVALMVQEMRPARLEIICRLYDCDERTIGECRIPNMAFPHVDAKPATAKPPDDR